MEFDGIEIEERIGNVLKELESGSAHYWNVARSTGVFLYGLVGFMDAKCVLEIGTSTGYSALFMAAALGRGDTSLKGGGRIYTVESHDERFELARHFFDKAGMGDFITQIKGHAPEIFSEFPKDMRFDMVFLDATKGEYESYITAIWPFLRPGGLIVADNCVSHAEEMRGFFERVRLREDMTSFLLPIDAGLFLIFKGW